MKIAVTGASGFIGQHVLDQLVRQNVKVVAVTRSALKLIDWADKINLVEMDIARFPPDGFDRIGRPEVLIHLAWAGLPNYQSLHHFETELPRHYDFLKSMIQEGLPSMFVAGTCFEYGMQSGLLSEDMPTNPETPYGYAKDALRRQLFFLQKSHSFSLQWARLFYMYGERQPKTSLYPLLKDAVIGGCPSFNMSGGEQVRDYLPVEEVARLIVQVALHCPKAGIINICSGKPVPIRELVQGWIEEMGWPIELNLGYYPYPDYEPMAFWGDRYRLDRLLHNFPE